MPVGITRLYTCRHGFRKDIKFQVQQDRISIEQGQQKFLTPFYISPCLQTSMASSSSSSSSSSWIIIMDHHGLFPAICSVEFQVTLFTPAETPKVGSCGNEHGNFIQFAGRTWCRAQLSSTRSPAVKPWASRRIMKGVGSFCAINQNILH